MLRGAGKQLRQGGLWGTAFGVHYGSFEFGIGYGDVSEYLRLLHGGKFGHHSARSRNLRYDGPQRFFAPKACRTWDLSLLKNWKFKERLTAQFRIEAFNILNITQYGAANNVLTTPATFGESLGTPDVINHNPLIGSGSARAAQLSLKLIF